MSIPIPITTSLKETAPRYSRRIGRVINECAIPDNEIIQQTIVDYLAPDQIICEPEAEYICIEERFNDRMNRSHYKIVGAKVNVIYDPFTSQPNGTRKEFILRKVSGSNWAFEIIRLTEDNFLRNFILSSEAQRGLSSGGKQPRERKRYSYAQIQAMRADIRTIFGQDDSEQEEETEEKNYKRVKLVVEA